MTQPQARVVKPRRRTRLIPTLFPNRGAQPPHRECRRSARPPLTVEQISYRRCVQRSVHLCLFYQCNPHVEAAHNEPTRPSLPTIGFGLQRLGVCERETSAPSLCRIEPAATQLEDKQLAAIQEPVRGVEACEPQSVPPGPSHTGAGRLRRRLADVTRTRAITHFGRKGPLSRRREPRRDLGCRPGRGGGIPRSSNWGILARNDAVASYDDGPLRVRLPRGQESRERVHSPAISGSNHRCDDRGISIGEHIWLINSVHEWRSAVMS
jgi:hypothetical protein